MSERSHDLAQRLNVFNNDVIRFVENCSQMDWEKVLSWEEWSVGVTARHIGAGHYDIMQLAKMIINSDKLPELTENQLNEMANQHAREHSDCTKDEVLAVLHKDGAAFVDFVTGLSDDELDRTGYLAIVGGDITTQKLIEIVVFESAGEHFANMKKALTA